VFSSIGELGEKVRATGYIADSIATTTVYLAARLHKPLLLEGPAGSGKTQLAYAVADAADTIVERLQCYEGINEEKAIGKFDEPLQRLCVELKAKSSSVDWESLQIELHGMAMLACSRQPKPIEAFHATPKATAVTRPDASPMPQPASTSPAPLAAPQAQPIAQTVPKVVVADHTEGPFQVGGQSFIFVEHVQSVEGQTSGDDSTVEWWELRDTAGKAVYRRQYPVGVENAQEDHPAEIGKGIAQWIKRRTAVPAE
jgi:hypothetical protein